MPAADRAIYSSDSVTGRAAGRTVPDSANPLALPNPSLRAGRYLTQAGGQGVVHRERVEWLEAHRADP